MQDSRENTAEGTPSEPGGLTAGKATVFEREQLLRLGREHAFRFFSNAENLALVTPPFLRFRLLSPTPIEMKRGTVIEYALRIWGVPVNWRTLISEWDPPKRFVDVQQKGPYALWRHEHTFEEAGEGTLMRDRVEYRAPLGPLGRFAEWLFVRRQIEAIWDFREKRIPELLHQQALQERA